MQRTRTKNRSSHFQLHLSTPPFLPSTCPLHLLKPLTQISWRQNWRCEHLVQRLLSRNQGSWQAHSGTPQVPTIKSICYFTKVSASENGDSNMKWRILRSKKNNPQLKPLEFTMRICSQLRKFSRATLQRSMSPSFREMKSLT
jgi:hypothetical protein